MHSLHLICAALAAWATPSDRLQAAPRRYGFPSSESVTTGIGTRDSRALPLTTFQTPKVVYALHLGQNDPPGFDPYFRSENASTTLSMAKTHAIELHDLRVPHDDSSLQLNLGSTKVAFAFTLSQFDPPGFDPYFLMENTIEHVS